MQELILEKFVKMTFSLKKRKRIKGHELFAPTSINPGTRRALSDTYIDIYIYIYIYTDVCIIYMLNYFDGHSMAHCQEIKCIVRTNTNAMSLPIYFCKVYIGDVQKHKRIQRYAIFVPKSINPGPRRALSGIYICSNICK